jgi:hypothetical protein
MRERFSVSQKTTWRDVRKAARQPGDSLGGGDDLLGGSESHFAGREALRAEEKRFRGNEIVLSAAESLSGFSATESCEKSGLPAELRGCLEAISLGLTLAQRR